MVVGTAAASERQIRYPTSDAPGMGEGRFNLMRRFAARSTLDVEDACERVRERLPHECALPAFHFDAERLGEGLECWGESANDVFGVKLTVATDYADLRGFATIYSIAADANANYHIHLFWNSGKVGEGDLKRVRDALAQVLGSPLIPLPLVSSRRGVTRARRVPLRGRWD